MKIADISIGEGHPLALIAGLNVLEDEASALECAEKVDALGSKHGLPTLFKASYDKANRTRADGFRGAGLERGLEIFEAIKRKVQIPVLTDIHESHQASRVAGVVDALQIPAMLCRQTDLLKSAAETGKPINIKKGQFIAPDDFRHAVEKLHDFGCQDVLVTERGTSFGYGELVVDMRSLKRMRSFAPVAFDATHSVQRPGRKDGASGGEREFVAPLARAATAMGVDALFIEVHPEPEKAPVDGPCQLTFDELDRLLSQVCSIRVALAASDANS